MWDLLAWLTSSVSDVEIDIPSLFTTYARTIQHSTDKYIEYDNSHTMKLLTKEEEAGTLSTSRPCG